MDSPIAWPRVIAKHRETSRPESPGPECNPTELNGWLGWKGPRGAFTPKTYPPEKCAKDPVSHPPPAPRKVTPLNIMSLATKN